MEGLQCSTPGVLSAEDVERAFPELVRSGIPPAFTLRLRTQPPIRVIRDLGPVGTEEKPVRRLDIAENELTRLTGLHKHMRLTTLNASHNAISGQGFTDLSDHAQLAMLNLAHNRITAVPAHALSSCAASLKALILSDNRLTDVSALSHLSQLNTLVLSHNRLATLPTGFFARMSSLTKLSLAHNLLTELPDTSSLRHLAELRVNDNRFVHVPAHVATRALLRLLDLGNNAIADWDQLLQLSDMPRLQNLNARGNPVCESMGIDAYASAMERAFPKLYVMDGQRRVRASSDDRAAGAAVSVAGKRRRGVEEGAVDAGVDVTERRSSKLERRSMPKLGFLRKDARAARGVDAHRRDWATSARREPEGDPATVPPGKRARAEERSRGEQEDDTVVHKARKRAWAEPSRDMPVDTPKPKKPAAPPDAPPHTVKSHKASGSSIPRKSEGVGAESIPSRPTKTKHATAPEIRPRVASGKPSPAASSGHQAELKSVKPNLAKPKPAKSKQVKPITTTAALVEPVAAPVKVGATTVTGGAALAAMLGPRTPVATAAPTSSGKPRPAEQAKKGLEPAREAPRARVPTFAQMWS